MGRRVPLSLARALCAMHPRQRQDRKVCVMGAGSCAAAVLYRRRRRPAAAEPASGRYRWRDRRLAFHRVGLLDRSPSRNTVTIFNAEVKRSGGSAVVTNILWDRPLNRRISRRLPFAEVDPLFLGSPHFTRCCQPKSRGLYTTACCRSDILA